ncbi:MAG: c-type cytochrome [Thermoanaerobaculia bacterium]
MTISRSIALAVSGLLLAATVAAGPRKRSRTPTPTAAPTVSPTRLAPTQAPPTQAPSTQAPAPTKAPAAAASPLIDAGKAVYMKQCQKCHGLKGEGVPDMYRKVSAKIVHLGSKEAQVKSDEDMKKAITDGIREMEPVEDLSPKDIAGLVAFMRSLKLEP